MRLFANSKALLSSTTSCHPVPSVRQARRRPQRPMVTTQSAPHASCVQAAGVSLKVPISGALLIRGAICSRAPKTSLAEVPTTTLLRKPFEHQRQGDYYKGPAS